ncbi:MAG: hypothetical protein PF541_07930, partial [Prolixibacteraceae bacterium]|nr:hypothetical protein [Prolixibacteraceae bacterium]
MKKILSVSTSILLAIIVLLLVLPIVFKGKINTMVLQKANDSVSASITYSAYKLSLLKSFPDFTATFSDVSVVGVDEFERDTLIAFHSLSAQIDIISILKNEGIIIKEIELNGATVQLIINEAGSKNWAIETQKENRNKEDLKTEPVAKESKPIKLLLQNIALSDFNFTYWSKKGNYAFSIKETNATISGELEGMNTLLNIELETPSINLNYDSIDYIKNGSFKVETILLADLNDYDFKFKAGDTKINNLPLRIDGGFSMPGDSMDFNIQFAVPEIDMNKLLTIIPEVYQ